RRRHTSFSRDWSSDVCSSDCVVSFTITVCCCVVALPLTSSYVQVITVVPCVVIGKTALFVTITVPRQLSVAVGTATSPSLTTHCASTSGNLTKAGKGLTVSSKVIVTAVVAVHPLKSVTVTV